MPGTPQDTALAVVNNMMALGDQLNTLNNSIAGVVLQYSNLGLSQLLEALPTCVTNPDGSLGAADAAPKQGNAIDNRVVAGLSLAISAYDLGVLLNILQEVGALLAGQTVTQQTFAPTIMATVSEV